ncbi:MAG TPA: CPBP family intramembrane glutamic endopeptidase [Tepidisphaeraceae bacterium]
MPAASAKPRSAGRRPWAVRSRNKSTSALRRYLEGSRTPLTSLLFVLPLLVLHEVGVQYYATLPGRVVAYRVAAFDLMVRLFHSCGASGQYLPALAVVAVLLSWHVARGDRWVVNTPLLPAMLVECLLLATPLLAVYFLFSWPTSVFMPGGDWKSMAALYLGAGVYEELVFRLAAFSVLSFLLIDLARIPRSWGVPAVVLTAAALFAGYHIWGQTGYPFQGLVFVALRGVYYGTIFVERGFGITAGVHTAYDLMLLALREMNARA